MAESDVCMNCDETGAGVSIEMSKRKVEAGKSLYPILNVSE